MADVKTENKENIVDYSRGDVELIKQVQEIMRTLEKRGYKPTFKINEKRIP